MEESPVTTKHLFLGGRIDGFMLDVHPSRNFVEIHAAGQEPQQYRRRVLDTRDGPLSIFTHGVECPLTLLVQYYSGKPAHLARDAAIANDATRYRALFAAEKFTIEPLWPIADWMRGTRDVPKEEIDTALDAGLNTGLIKLP
jgi:hypothetical protein